MVDTFDAMKRIGAKAPQGALPVVAQGSPDCEFCAR